MLPPKKRLLDQVRDRLRLKITPTGLRNRISIGSNNTSIHNKRHPNEMGGPEIEQFLTHLATTKKVAASTQNPALSALLFSTVKCLTYPSI